MNRLPPPLPSRNSYVKHRRDVTVQIILPVVLVALLVIGVAALLFAAAFQGTGDVSTWAAIATIWIIAPLMVLMLVILAAACGLVFLLSRLLKISPRYTGVAQQYALWFNEQVVIWTDRIIQPILQFKAWLALFSRGE